VNNIIVLGKVISKSSIHFDYLDKLKAYFKINILENGNLFEVIVSEKYIGIDAVNEIYNKVLVNAVICVYGSINNNENS